MKNASTLLLLAAALVRGVCCGRVLKATPTVGLGTMREPTASTSQAESSSPGIDEKDEEEFIEALEVDDQVTVVSAIKLGPLLCDVLVNAEDAATLSFVLLEDERVTAEKISYTATDGEAFTDGIGRKVWMGVVTDPPQAEDEADPRMISMAWGDVCDTETFLLQVTKRTKYDKTRIVKTVPCFGSTTDTCLVEVELDFQESDDAMHPDDVDILQSSGSATDREGTTTSSGGSGISTSTPGSSDRRLQMGTVIDVMVLYSDLAMTTLGGVTPQQLETIILDSLAGTNQAMVNSGISAYINPVFIGLVPYEVNTFDSASALTELRTNADVGILRDSVGADLVQLITDFDDSCGLGYLFDTYEAFGFSVVQATCIYNLSHTHELGHNLGCHHNRDDTSHDHGYAHGYRYCDGEDPYRTIMGVSCRNPRVNYFSNPDVMHLNKPTGTLANDNARVIEDNMVAVSNYRNTVTPPTPAPTTAPPTTAPPNAAPTPAPTFTRPTPAPVIITPPTPAPAIITPPTHAPSTPPPTTVHPTAAPIPASTSASPTITHDISTPSTPASTTVPPTTALPTPAPSVAPTTTAPAITVPPTPAPTTAPPTSAPAITVLPTPAPTTAPLDTVSPAPGSGTEPPATGPTAAYTLVGCFADNTGDRVLSGRFVKSDMAMTTEVCADFCEGSPYFGTQYGQECFCGVNSDDPARRGDATCASECAGDASQTCGGLYAISVYEYTSTVDSSSEYLGCWGDFGHGRIMDVVQSDSSMTNELCEEICSSYAFFGTEYGLECWCGDGSTDYTTHGESTACTRNCAGDAGTKCGGFNAMSVWRSP